MLSEKKRLIMFGIVFFNGFNWSCSNELNNPLDQQLQTGRSFFSLVYNKEFSERFQLDQKEAIDLNEGLQAVAIEIRRVNYEYQCLLHFYIDDTVDVYIPSDGHYYYYVQEAEQFFIDTYSAMDQKWHSNAIDLNTAKMVFIQDNVATGGWVSSLHYDMVHQSFLPNLNIISTQIFCYALGKAYSPAKVRIQKSNIKNYLAADDDLVNPKHKENFVVLPVPEKLINQAAPYIEIAARKVNQSLDL